MSETDIIEIGPRDTAWHQRFFRHAADIFGGIDFVRCAALGGWGENYRVLAVVEGEELVATVGVSQMRLCLADEQYPVEGLQLGAVATRSGRRGEGHARRLMDHVLSLADACDAPVLLFANSSVTDFYPKFGFRRMLAQRLYAEIDIDPGTDRARRLDIGLKADRDLLVYLCAASPAHGGVLSARPDASTLLWYLCNGFSIAYILEDGKSAVFVEQNEDHLLLQEYVGTLPANLAAALSSIVSAGITTVEFGFLPQQSWPAVPLLIEDDPDTLMFWRGKNLPSGILRFPALMQT